MSLIAAVILFVAAFTHAGWNFSSKKENPTLAFYLVANLIGVLCVLPIFCIYRHQIPLIPPLIWGFLICSGFFLAVYMAFLAGAYRTGDFSVAYPSKGKGASGKNIRSAPSENSEGSKWFQKECPTPS
jgi:uncharacterized membrane protein